MKTKDERGFTMLEAVLTITVVGVLCALSPRLLRTAQTFFNQSLARNDVQRDLRVALDQMNRMLRQASAASVTVTQDAGQLPLSKISFTMPDGGSVSFALENRQLVRFVGTQSAVLASNVEYLAFTYPHSDDNTVLSVALTLKKKTFGGSTQLQGTTASVRVMNP